MNKELVWRKDLMRVMAAKAYLADAAKQQIPVNPVSGEEVQAFIAKLFKMPKDVVDRANRAADGDPAFLADAKLNWITVKGAALAKVEGGGRTIHFTDNGKPGRATTGGHKNPVAGKTAKPKRMKAGRQG